MSDEYEQMIDLLASCRECGRAFAMSLWVSGESWVTELRATMPCPDCGRTADANVEVKVAER